MYGRGRGFSIIILTKEKAVYATRKAFAGAAQKQNQYSLILSCNTEFNTVLIRTPDWLVNYDQTPIQREYFARADLAVSVERQKCKVVSRPCKNCKSRLAECGGSEKDPTCTIIMHQHYSTASRNLRRYQYMVSDHLCSSHEFTVGYK